MPVNKNAIIRYQILDRCFRNTGRRYYIEDLVEEVNEKLAEINPKLKVCKRQVQDDMKFMESSEGWSADIVRIKDGKRVFYRYADPAFSINNIPLRRDEIAKINAAIDVLRRFEGMPQFDWVYEIIPLLQDKLGLSREPYRPVVSFHYNRDLKGLEFIAPIFNAIVNRMVLSITYKRFEIEQATTFYFHPYLLKEYNNRWYAVGFNQGRQLDGWVVALDRIDGIEEVHAPYRESDIDWEEYFYDVIGTTRPADVEPIEVTLRFSPNRAPYVATKPLHPSQRHRFIDGVLEARIRVVPNNELMALLLSYSPDIEVVGPSWLRERYTDIIEQALLRHKK